MGVAVFPAAGGGVTQKIATFTSTGTFTAPSNVTTVEVFLVGGGGGGGCCRGVNTDYYNASGAGGGGAVRKAFLAVTPGQSYTVTIGAGGAGAVNSAAAGSVGGDSSFGALLTALGGGSGAGKNESTHIIGTSRGTGGGAGNNGTQSPAGCGGGAGGSASWLNTSTTPFSASIFTDARTTLSVQGSSNTMGVGGAGTPMNSQSGDGYTIAGIGIDGYGAGGIGGHPGTNTTMIATGYSGVPLTYTTGSGTKADGGSGQANSGNGGNGGALRAGGSQIFGNGGSGGSGFCRVIYWS